MRRLITLLLIIPALAVGQSRFGHGGSGGVSVSSLLPIIADSTLWHLQGADTLVTDGALPIKVSGIRVSGTTRLDGTLTLITTAAESLIIGAGGFRNEGGLLQKGPATFGATGTQATISAAGKITSPDTVVSTLGIRTEGIARAKGTATFGATATPTVIGTAGEMDLGAATDNANMTVGLTIDQGANDDEILALKSTDVAHGFTTKTETATYGTFKKNVATLGGLKISGYTESYFPGLYLEGYCVSNPNVTSYAPVIITGGKQSGTTVTSVAETEYLIKFTNNGNVVGTFLGNGNLGLGTESPKAKVSVVGADGTGTGIHVVSTTNLRRDSWAQATDTSSVAIRVDSAHNPRIGFAAADGDSARIHVRSDSTEFYSKNAIVFDAPAVLIGASNVGVSKIDTVFTAGFVPRWVKFTSGAKSWYSPVYADTTGKW